MLSIHEIRKISKILRVLGQPDRLQILLEIGEGEACVCHLKAILKKRQAFISQHLMAMRDAEILGTRRDGRFIYYKVKNNQVFDLIRIAGSLVNIQVDSILQANGSEKVSGCECPKCADNLPHQLLKVEDVLIK